MPEVIGTIREFHTKNFAVIIDALPEYDVDLSWDEDGETLRKLQSGEYVAFVARARVLLNGAEIAADYLGGCIYESIDEFMDHQECAKSTRELRANGENACVGSYFSDMVHSVCKLARKQLADIKNIHIRGGE